MGRRARAFAVAFGAVFAVGAPAAHAGQLTASYTSGTLTYSAASGENNRISAIDMLTFYQVGDPALSSVDLSVLGGGSCSSMELWKYKCLSAGLSKLVVNLGDGTDTLDLSHSSLPTVVTAGTGTK